VSDLQRTIDYETHLTGLAPSKLLTIEQTNDSLRHNFNDALQLDPNENSLRMLEEWTSSMIAELSHLFEEGDNRQ
jgi:hypothetical protein